MGVLAQNLDVGHHAMTTDDPGEILDGRQVYDFLIERDDFIVILARMITISLKLLRPCDQQAEISGFGELRQLGGLR